MTRTFKEGDRVHVEFDGEVVEPFYAVGMEEGSYSEAQLYGWLEIRADHGPNHVIWASPSQPGQITHIEPEYKVGAAYADATGRPYVRHSNVEHPWLAPSGLLVNESRPTKPMRRLV